jgi:hypothetical protein
MRHNQSQMTTGVPPNGIVTVELRVHLTPAIWYEQVRIPQVFITSVKCSANKSLRSPILK